MEQLSKDQPEQETHRDDSPSDRSMQQNESQSLIAGEQPPEKGLANTQQQGNDIITNHQVPEKTTGQPRTRPDTDPANREPKKPGRPRLNPINAPNKSGDGGKNPIAAPKNSRPPRTKPTVQPGAEKKCGQPRKHAMQEPTDKAPNEICLPRKERHSKEVEVPKIRKKPGRPRNGGDAFSEEVPDASDSELQEQESGTDKEKQESNTDNEEQEQSDTEQYDELGEQSVKRQKRTNADESQVVRRMVRQAVPDTPENPHQSFLSFVHQASPVSWSGINSIRDAANLGYQSWVVRPASHGMVNPHVCVWEEAGRANGNHEPRHPSAQPSTQLVRVEPDSAQGHPAFNRLHDIDWRFDSMLGNTLCLVESNQKLLFDARLWKDSCNEEPLFCIAQLKPNQRDGQNVPQMIWAPLHCAFRTEADRVKAAGLRQRMGKDNLLMSLSWNSENRMILARHLNSCQVYIVDPEGWSQASIAPPGGTATFVHQFHTDWLDADTFGYILDARFSTQQSEILYLTCAEPDIDNSMACMYDLIIGKPIHGWNISREEFKPGKGTANRRMKMNAFVRETAKLSKFAKLSPGEGGKTLLATRQHIYQLDLRRKTPSKALDLQTWNVGTMDRHIRLFHSMQDVFDSHYQLVVTDSVLAIMDERKWQNPVLDLTLSHTKYFDVSAMASMIPLPDDRSACIALAYPGTCEIYLYNITHASIDAFARAKSGIISLLDGALDKFGFGDSPLGPLDSFEPFDIDTKAAGFRGLVSAKKLKTLHKWPPPSLLGMQWLNDAQGNLQLAQLSSWGALQCQEFALFKGLQDANANYYGERAKNSLLDRETQEQSLVQTVESTFMNRTTKTSQIFGSSFLEKMSHRTDTDPQSQVEEEKLVLSREFLDGKLRLRFKKNLFIRSEWIPERPILQPELWGYPGLEVGHTEQRIVPLEPRLTIDEPDGTLGSEQAILSDELVHTTQQNHNPASGTAFRLEQRPSLIRHWIDASQRPIN